ncbi:DUF551 domain-containing protein [Enterobacter hormaechei subsp. hoffmannii]|nr:DUF551 domain-containing protein [Enterobacter hormaechei subsp. hoffmannii]
MDDCEGNKNCDVVKEMARIALASLEAEPVAWLLSGGGAKNNVSFDSGNAYADPLREVTPLYTAPPAPVSVPAAMEIDDDFDSAFEHGKAVGWNAYRAAMLQGADGTLTNEGTIPVTQFKPVADLYGLTSPTGGETSFTFDAVEARDFIDGGWSCQEYVELERFQEAITNHTEDKLAMVDHSGDSNNMVEPVTTAYKLPDDFDFDRFNDVVWLEAVASNPHMHSLTTSTIAMVALELNRKLADCDSPVIPDGWIPVSERMPGSQEWVIVFAKWDNQQVLCWDDVANRWTDFEDQSYYADMFTHWMPLPAAPQQEDIIC